MCVADPKRIFGHPAQTGVITGDVPISGVPESVLSSVQWNVSDINENKTRMIFTFIKNLNWRFVIPHTSVIIETFSNQSSDQKNLSISNSDLWPSFSRKRLIFRVINASPKRTFKDTNASRLACSMLDLRVWLYDWWWPVRSRVAFETINFHSQT